MSSPDDPTLPQPRRGDGAPPSPTPGSDGAWPSLPRSAPGVRWVPPTPLELQEQMPQYKVLELLGHGGMGAVFKGWQSSLERYVAIKILPPALEDEEANFGARFKQEARTMAKLSHPGIVPVHDAGESAKGLLYFVMEFVDGTDVAQMIKTQGALPAESALAITAHVCDALHYAHTHGVVHRDIKPANVMLNTEGVVKVADFGLAKALGAGSSGLTKSNMSMGTPDYIAPEALIAGVVADHRADVYAVGVMLYQMLTGKVPRGMSEAPSVRVPGLDPRFDAIVQRAMKEEREERYQSAADMRRALDVILSTPVEKVESAALGAPPTSAAQTSARKPVTRGPGPSLGEAPSVGNAAGGVASAPRKKSSAGMIAAILGTLAVLGGGAFFVFQKPADTRSGDTPRASTSSSTGSAPHNGPTAVKNTPLLESFLTAATKDKPFINTLGMKFVPVPILSGPTANQPVLFGVWDVRVQDYAAYAKAQESAGKKVDGWWKTAQKDGVPIGGELDDPVVGVNWEDAQAFCAWLTEKETAEGKLPKGAAYRLPGDEEWSWGVGLPPEVGKTPEEKHGKNDVNFPWGREWPPVRKVGNYADESFHGKFPKPDAKDPEELPNKWIEGYSDGYATTSPGGAFPANAYGLHDMGGNVFQWCEDWWNADHKDRVLRGASWCNYDRNSLRSSYRIRIAPTIRSYALGFRCVVGASAPGSASASPAGAAAPAVSTSPNPQVSSSSPTTATAGGTPPAAERWQDVLRDPAKLDLTGGAMRTPEGVRLTPGSAAMLNSSQGLRRDGAVRVRATFDRLPPALHARWTGEIGYYSLRGSEQQIILMRYDHATKRWTILREFPLREPLQPGKVIELELRVVGQTLTAKLNGEILGSVTDGTYPEGSLGAVAGGGDHTAPALIKSLEVLDLDSQGGSGASPLKPAPPSGGAPLSLATATKDAPFVNTLGMKFVPVPILSGPTANQRVLFGVWDVRVQDYAAYAAASKSVDGGWKTLHKEGVPVGRDPDHPVGGVSWEDAQAFCKWLTEKETAEGKLPKGARYRLPSDEEWSWAAAMPPEVGATPEEKNGKNDVDFPWGKEWPPVRKVGNYADESLHGKFPVKQNEKENSDESFWIKDYDDGFAFTSPVGKFPANAHGLYDMGGNVWQWCENWWNAEHEDRVLRGASWGNGTRRYLRSSYRHHYAPTARFNGNGFRCVVDVSAPAAPEGK